MEKTLTRTPEEIAAEHVAEQLRKAKRNEKARKKRKKKAERKYRHRMPQKIVPVPNADKGNWVESWDKPKGRPISLFPHPTRAIFTGNTGLGKSTAMLNCFLQVQASNRPFREVHVVCCDVGSREWDHIEPTSKRETLPDIAEFDGKRKVLLIIDDWDCTKISKDQQRLLSKWFRYGSTHLNTSIYMSYQSCFHVPTIARRCSNLWHIWRPSSDTELRMIGERCGMKAEEITDLFDSVCTHFRDFLTVDLTVNTPQKLRKNIFYPIAEIQEDSD